MISKITQPIANKSMEYELFVEDVTESVIASVAVSSPSLTQLN